MARVKVTTRFKILELIDKFVDGATANAIGQTVVKEAKQNIAEGLSPVRGYGRFERYKDRKKYPGDLKPSRPVNLELTGEMLEGYDYRVTSNDTIEVGMVKGSAFAKEKAAHHNAGTPYMAQRKIIPGDGEEWSVTIMRAIRDIYGKRLENLIRQGNKKA